MEEGIKKDIWLVFSVASFLFVTIFFILPYLVQISTYFHEKGHQNTLANYGIDSEYKIDLLLTIPNFYNPRIAKLGVTRFDLNEYMKLGNEQKRMVNIAGIVSDLRFLFLIGIYLALTNVYLFYKIRFKKEMNFTWVMAINWILFMWLLALIQITVANVSFVSGDVGQLVKWIVG